MVGVPVVPAVLVWARKERGLSLAAAAVRLKLSESELSDIEAGGRPEISLGFLDNIATGYRIPLAALLMPEAPELVGTPLIDHRVFEGSRPRDLSAETLMAISDSSALLEMLSDLRETYPERLGQCLVPPAKLSDDPSAIAARERQRLGVLVREQCNWKNGRTAFLRWREAVESQGIFTYQMRLGDDGVRGVCVWDNSEIPVVVVDSAEGGYHAKIFTLMHEYGHVVLRMGGISDQNKHNRVERFCNSFAAYFLMPPKEFAQRAREVGPRNGKWTLYHLSRVANFFGVSKSSAAIHLEELNLAPSGFYASIKTLLKSKKSDNGRAKHHEKIANRLGTRHILTVMTAYRGGVINRLDTKEMLDNTKPIYFEQVEEEALSRRAVYGREIAA
jgi:Zn-dependent peptidase ImmA (M78 family)